MAHEFTVFTQLPLELQTQIWHWAIPFFYDRQIRVAIYYKASMTEHSCYVETGQFCGRHGTCERFVEDSPWEGVFCMTDGYFALSPDFPGSSPFQKLLSNLQLTCRESCNVARKRYPAVMRVYEEKWHPGVRVRTLRCDPANDILIVMNAHSEIDMHIRLDQVQHASANIWTLTQERNFPQDRQQFKNFRRVLSSFQNAGFRHVDEDLLRVMSFDPPAPGGPSLAPVTSDDLETLSLYMESRENFYLWLDPDSFPEVQISGRKRIEDLSIFRERESENSILVYYHAMALLDSYSISAKAARDHYIATSDHWTPKPRDIEKVGCYIPARWVGLITFD